MAEKNKIWMQTIAFKSFKLNFILSIFSSKFTIILLVYISRKNLLLQKNFLFVSFIRNQSFSIGSHLIAPIIGIIHSFLEKFKIMVPLKSKFLQSEKAGIKQTGHYFRNALKNHFLFFYSLTIFTF